ncbi:Vacuolar iron transporter-like protein 4-like [Heracleum sosnowskyi]|uniref:Vacuolar iron transporter n=1 Tax=Heracleum sosnowskyi TaxID=360622 RepID=A0AAD8JEX3_9APIA|nr:Vacuolar iron transporter-like protein 4-like [Heracleum sosnowskyi]
MQQIKRESLHGNITKAELEVKKKKVPSPLKAAAASTFMFAIGAVAHLLAAAPLLAAAAFVMDYHVRLMVVTGAVSFALIGFGGLSSMLGKAPMVKSILRVLVGGWLAMGITFGLTKLVGSGL